MISVITMTGDRHTAFGLCERWMSAQSEAPEFEWIVVDDGKHPTRCGRRQHYIRRQPSPRDPPHTLTLNLAAGLQAAQGDKVVIVEDDDFYDPGYLAWMSQALDTHAIAGEGLAPYYNVRLRSWYQHANRQHASLCSTGFRAELIPLVLDLCSSPNPFLDLRLWQAARARRLDWRVFVPTVDGPRRVVGMKGLPGRSGIGVGHRDNGCRWVPDPSWYMLGQLVGDDAATAYRGVRL